MQIIFFIVSFLISIFFYKSTFRFKNYFPNFRFKNIEFFPVLRINFSGRVIHIHHWFWSSILLLSITFFVDGGRLDNSLIKGFLTGAIIEGITYPDREIVQRKHVKHN
ncbi:hypothetical protein A2686_05030 [Candidatus Woesebacteria bacterium RIFCSPHIGHO2_01_FULL_38_10]|uniref:Uncharacterized protein n=1 Tax=Candidatus Woesebacteria bacterium RIFCSPLOWO2_01_FULL_39_10b TaxID=1802517 RepID=A0A1F8B665_9BACT|nr:MAG: hypothetical protein A2686_05030 [Candidatus Woesebacteria bacterium RIFCSPHIGHO2_01_FULL_38_10]OGM59487.1 MAG: hypothetical protein A2892_02470 [Candidatus Woesebacteria bacterium RIFCSPLOWO2_01_FULL_39_10b]